MNKKVQEFINRKKQEEAARKKEEREELLISLGLVEECVIKRNYGPSEIHGEVMTFDEENKSYYREEWGFKPIEITDEEYQELLKYVSITGNKKDKTKWSNVISSIADIMFGIHILVGVFLVSIFEDELLWATVFFVFMYCVLYYPLIKGFAKIVETSENYFKAK